MYFAAMTKVKPTCILGSNIHVKIQCHIIFWRSVYSTNEKYIQDVNLERLQLSDGHADRVSQLLDVLHDIVRLAVLVALLLIRPVLDDAELVIHSLRHLLIEHRGLAELVSLKRNHKRCFGH